MNGTLTAQNIRKRDSKVIILFYSQFESPASRISSIRPYDYLLKQYSKEELTQCLDIVLEEVQNREEVPRLPVVCDGKIFILRISDIIYIQIYRKGSQIWLTDKKTEEIWGSGLSEKERKQTIETKTRLKEYYQELKDYGFIYASESYIINAEKVVSRQKDFVRMQGGHNLSVVRRMKKAFDEELGKYYGVRYKFVYASYCLFGFAKWISVIRAKFFRLSINLCRRGFINYINCNWFFYCGKIIKGRRCSQRC